MYRRRRRDRTPVDSGCSIPDSSSTQHIMSANGTHRRPFIILATLCLIIGCVIGILIGYFAIRNGRRNADQMEDESISNRLLETMDPQRIRENLRFLTKEPHLAGTPISKTIAEWIQNQWLEQGLDKAEIFPYEVLLSYPSDVPGEENRVQLLAGNGSVAYECQLNEKTLDEASRQSSGVIPPFNAYSPPGNIEGDMVYANYGRTEDFLFLTRTLDIDVKDKIIIARYGAIYRGDKVHNAGEFGAKGIILYSDPADWSEEGEAVYPDSLYLPGTGVQRGGTLSAFGDPQTPGYPSVGTSYRHPKDNLTVVPSIPVHPIGSDDAKEFLKRLGGDEVVADWKGRIEGITYRYGPGFASPDNDKRVAMKIFTHTQLAWGYNVVGTIRGHIEPDRYVLMGNHHDAWGYGAMDPSSGTVVMMEVSRAYGQMMKQGWRPRRTIMFCAWDAEEYGLIGSTEWVEDFSKNLAERAVVYFNVDIAVSGNHVLNVFDTPGISNAVYAAARKIPDPSPSGDRKTVYDTWAERSLRGRNEDGTPVIVPLGSGSDFAPFVQLIGVSAFDSSYIHDMNDIPIDPYPLYHSVYETFYAVETHLDPEFKFHLASAQLYGELIRDFADSVLLPMDCEYYATAIQGFVKTFKSGETGTKMLQNGMTLDGLQSAADNLTKAAGSLKQRIDKVDAHNSLQVRQLNDQMMKLERAFIDPLGLPERPFIRHVVFAPSSKNIYASDKFSGVTDTMFDIDNNPDVNKWEHVKQQLAAVTFAIQSAASTLTDVA